MTCTPLPASALSDAARVATTPFPSPALSTAILPWCRTMPPISCTSKWRMRSVRFAASRVSANISSRTSSRVAPSRTRARRPSTRSRIAASDRGATSASRALMAATRGTIFLSSRSFFVPKSALRMVSTIILTGYDKRQRPPDGAARRPDGSRQALEDLRFFQDVDQRVDRLLVDHHLVVQVRPGAAAGRTGGGDRLAPADPLPDLHGGRAQVPIAGDHAVPVRDEQRQSEPAGRPHPGHDAV